jgi:hypothetical protein
VRRGAGTACCSTAVGRSDKLAFYYTQTENSQAFRVAAREQMQCANVFSVVVIITRHFSRSLRTRIYRISSRDHLLVCGQ